MDDHDLSHIPTLLQALSDRIKDLNHEFEILYIKVELTLDLWNKIKLVSQQEINNRAQKLI